jgi:hypothetical protein
VKLNGRVCEINDLPKKNRILDFGIVKRGNEGVERKKRVRGKQATAI